MGKVYTFFENLKEKDMYRYFLMNKFYYDYKSILYNARNKDNNRYYDYEVLKKYMFNNDLLNLIINIFDDEDYEFINSLDYTNLKVLLDLINDAYEIARNTKENNYDYKDLLRYLKYHIKYKELFDDKKSINSIKEYDLDLSFEVIDLLKDEINVRYEHTVKPFKNKKEILNKIISENCDNNDYVLNKYPYDSSVIMFSLICNNDFLEIIEHVLLNKNLSVKIINNIINILITSSNIYYGDADTIFEKYALENLDNIETYNIKKAENLIYKLEKKRVERRKHNKVVKFDYLA